MRSCASFAAQLNSKLIALHCCLVWCVPVDAKVQNTSLTLRIEKRTEIFVMAAARMVDLDEEVAQVEQLAPEPVYGASLNIAEKTNVPLERLIVQYVTVTGCPIQSISLCKQA